MKADPISCAGGCKVQLADDKAAAAAGWSFYSVIRKWRCGACDRALAAATHAIGPAENPPDLLAPDDRGALPMPGGFGIVPVMVKG